MKKIICFSLWGNNPKYTIGAIRNAELVKSIYPGWIARFYCGTSVPQEIISKLLKLNSEVRIMNTPGDWSGMFWRFEAIAEPDVEVMLSRDTDSRLSLREAMAVKQWLLSGKLFHVMRDHPEHNTEILGGMWGARKPILQDIKHLLDGYKKGDFWQVDQNFLREVVWSRVAYTTCTHDPFFAKVPFPFQREGLEFIGEVYDEKENTVPEHSIALRKALGKDKKHIKCSQYGECYIFEKMFEDRPNGYFIDIGAADGFRYSNTINLINKGWQGVAVEPCRHYLDVLKKNYTTEKVDIFPGAVSNYVGKSKFYVWREGKHSQISTIEKKQYESIKESDFWKKEGRFTDEYEVEIIDPKSLLEKYDAPRKIQLVDIDAEASEMDILNAWPWDMYEVEVFCIEFSMGKKILNDFMTSKGYNLFVQTGGNSIYCLEKEFERFKALYKRF